MAHTQPPADGSDPGRRGFIGLIAAGVAALIGWPVLRSVFRADETTTAAPASTSSTAGPTTTAPSSTSGPTAASSTTAGPATTTTTSPTEVAGATVTTSPSTTGTPATTAPPATTSATTSTTAVSTTSTTAASTTSTTAASGRTLGAVVIEKAAWSETPDASGFVVQEQITAITIHHTAVFLDPNTSAVARLRQHEAYHRSVGWPDIAYHMMIDRDGNIFEGRPLWAVGDTFTNYDPAGHFHPVLEGDFDSQAPSAAQTEALATITAWAINHYGLDLSVVAGHQDRAATRCPGGRLYSFITSAEFSAMVSNRMGRGVELSYLRGQDAVDLVASL